MGLLMSKLRNLTPNTKGIDGARFNVVSVSLSGTYYLITIEVKVTIFTFTLFGYMKYSLRFLS